MSEHISSNLNVHFSKKFDFIPLFHDKNIIDNLLNVQENILQIDISNNTVMLGNLYKGKLASVKKLNKYDIIHFGKLHGNHFDGIKSIDKYLSFDEFYFIIKNSKKLLINYSNKYRYIASGIFSDAIVFRGKILSNNNPYITHIVEKYNLATTNITSDIIEIEIGDLYHKLKKEFKSKLSSL